jgi:hypothetical protein
VLFGLVDVCALLVRVYCWVEPCCTAGVVVWSSAVAQEQAVLFITGSHVIDCSCSKVVPLLHHCIYYSIAGAVAAICWHIQTYFC